MPTQAHSRSGPERLRAAALGAAVALGMLSAAPALRAADDPSQPGAYCPFPEPGQAPVCFTEVEQEYADFLTAVDKGRIDDPNVAALERTLAEPDAGRNRSLALSSLAYGYFMLAGRAASAERPDPALVARLEHWNELLGAVYQDPASQPAFRTAVRQAALDLHARAPAVPLGRDECEAAADGQPCPSTSALLATLRRIDDPDADLGVRGALGKLLGRMLDTRDSPDEEPEREGRDQ